MTTEKLNTKFVTPEIICSYPALVEPQEDLSGNLKYGLSIPIPKKDTATLAAIKECVKGAVINKWGLKAASSQEVAFTMNDSTEKGKDEDPVYKDTFSFSAKSNSKPGLVDAGLNPIMDKNEIYAGCIIRASMNFYGTEVGGGKRVAVGLNNVMKVKDGERIGGRSSATDDFADFETEGFQPAGIEEKPAGAPVDMFAKTEKLPF